MLERNPRLRDAERKSSPQRKNPSPSKHLHRVYPVSLQRSSSSFSNLSTLSSLSLSQNSNDSSLNFSMSSWDRKFSSSFQGILRSLRRRREVVDGMSPGKESKDCSFDEEDSGGLLGGATGLPSTVVSYQFIISACRMYWTDSSKFKASKLNQQIDTIADGVYVTFHDECWGVPVYDDSQLFELLALSGMLIDLNWTEILKRREQYREVFAKFDYDIVAKMEEKDILEISLNKELMLVECRVRCIVDNAKCIQKVVKEFGSFSAYIWGHVNYRPMINRYKYQRSVPLRTPKSEAISRDMLKRGFWLVGPVIIYSFMQTAGMVIDHLVDCFRFGECLTLVESSAWDMNNGA